MMTLVRFKVGLGLTTLVLCIYGCGGKSTDGGGSVAVTLDDMRTYCEASCDHEMRCDAPSDSGSRDVCVTECMKQADITVGLFRQDLYRHHTDCYGGGLACGDDTDDCLDGTLALVGLTEGWHKTDPDHAACNAKSSECEGLKGPAWFPPGICYQHKFFVTEKRKATAQCFDEPCDTIRDCTAPFTG